MKKFIIVSILILLALYAILLIVSKGTAVPPFIYNFI